jgi:hypothetical protein
MVNDFLTKNLVGIYLEVRKVVVVGGRVGWVRAGVCSNPTLVNIFWFPLIHSFHDC